MGSTTGRNLPHREFNVGFPCGPGGAATHGHAVGARGRRAVNGSGQVAVGKRHAALGILIPCRSRHFERSPNHAGARLPGATRRSPYGAVMAETPGVTQRRRVMLCDLFARPNLRLAIFATLGGVDVGAQDCRDRLRAVRPPAAPECRQARTPRYRRRKEAGCVCRAWQDLPLVAGDRLKLGAEVRLYGPRMASKFAKSKAVPQPDSYFRLVQRLVCIGHASPVAPP